MCGQCEKLFFASCVKFLIIFTSLFLNLCNSNSWEISSTVNAPGRSCLFAKIKIQASRSSSSWQILCNSLCAQKTNMCENKKLPVLHALFWKIYHASIYQIVFPLFFLHFSGKKQTEHYSGWLLCFPFKICVSKLSQNEKKTSQIKRPQNYLHQNTIL